MAKKIEKFLNIEPQNQNENGNANGNENQNEYENENSKGLYKFIDLEAWSRKIDFEFFINMDKVIFMSADLDVTNLVAYAKEKGLKLSLLVVYILAYATNEIEDFRVFYKTDATGKPVPILYDRLNPDMPILNMDDEPINISIPYLKDFAKFYASGEALIEVAKTTLENRFDAVENYLICSYVPYPFTSMTVICSAEPEKPILCWGKYKKVGDTLMMPLTINVHHAFVDGKRIADLYNLIGELCQEPERLENLGK